MANLIGENANQVPVNGMLGDLAYKDANNIGLVGNFESTGIDDNATSTVVTINDSGNVGIGTSSPSTLLHIARSDMGEVLRFQNTSSSFADFVFELESSGTDYGLNLKNHTGTSLANFSKNGRFGLLTNDPSSEFHINHSADNHAQIQIGYNSTALGIGHTSSGQGRNFIGHTYDNAATKLSFVIGGYTTDYDRLTILGSGNVGIGTTSPTDKLDVAGNTVFKNGTTPTSLTMYNTYTDASNYERGFMKWDSNVLKIGTESAGTGSDRYINFVVAGSVKWKMLNNGSLQPASNNYADLGASYPRLRTVYATTIDLAQTQITDESETLATVTQTEIASFSATTYQSGKFIIQAKDTVSGEVHTTELLVIHDGTTASATEYGTIYTGSAELATYDVDISSGNVRILATGASANSTDYKVSETLIKA